MNYKPQITKDEAIGYSRSSKRALDILKRDKFTARSIRVGTTKKVALLQDGDIKHIIPRSCYIKFSQPEIVFNY